MGTDHSEDKIRAAAERQKAFEEKYEDVINALKEMPAGTKEERSQRWEWFRGLDVRDDFKLDLMQMIRPRKLEKIKRYLSSMPGDPGGGRYAEAPQDVGMARLDIEWKYFLDPLVFEEALKKVVESYKIGEDGEEISLSACMRKEYDQVGSLETGRNAINENSGLVLGIRDRRKYAVLSLVRHVGELMETMDREKGIDRRKKIEELVNGIGKNLSREEVREAVRLVEGIKSISLDQDETREALEKEGQDFLSAGDEADPYKGILLDSTAERFGALVESAGTGWKEIKSASGKRDRELIKAFISKEILIAMKLEYLQTDERAKWKEELEPKCGQWCQRRERCAYGRKEGCYIRYGKRIPSEEAGDEELYEYLAENADKLYEFILKNDYTDYAFEESVNSLHDIYAKSLKDFKGEGETFQFTDAVMGEALGLKPYVISRSRKQYETKTKEELYKIFYSKREE